jgi:hypothetical protein
MALSDLLTVPALVARTTPGFINVPTYNTPISNTPISNTPPVDVNYAPLINQSTTPTYGGTTGSSILNALGQGQAQATKSDLLQSLWPGLVTASIGNLLSGKDITTGYGRVIGSNLTNALTEGQAGAVGSWAGGIAGNAAEKAARSLIEGKPMNLTSLLPVVPPTGPGGSTEAAMGSLMGNLIGQGLSTGFAASTAAAPTISSLAGGTLGGALSTLAPVIGLLSIPIMGMIGGALGWGDEASRASMAEGEYRKYQAVAPAVQRYVKEVQAGTRAPVPEVEDYLKTLIQQKAWYDQGKVLIPGVAPSDEVIKAMTNNQILWPNEQAEFVGTAYTKMGQEHEEPAGPTLISPQMLQSYIEHPSTFTQENPSLTILPTGQITGGPMYDPNAPTTWSVMGQEHANTYTGTMKQRYGDLLRAAGYNPDVPMSLDLVEALERKAISSSNPNEMGGR